MKKSIVSLIMIMIMFTVLGQPNTLFAASEKQEITYLPILMYHQISSDESKLSEYVISPEEFENDLKLIKKHGYTTVTIEDLLNYTTGLETLPKKPIMLTFDDGFESDYVYAFPLLESYNEKAVFSIIGKFADLYSGEVQKHISYSHLSWEQIKEMYHSGLAEFHNHTYDLHSTKKRRGALMNKSETFEEYEKAIANDLDILNNEFGNHIGITSTAFTCPYGFYNNNLKQAIKDLGYTAILTSNEKINTLSGDPEELYSLNRFVRSHKMDIETFMNIWDIVSSEG